MSSPPVWAVPAERFDGADTVVNRGRRRAAASVTRYFVAAGGRRRTVGRREVPALRRGASSRGVARLMLPASLPDGEYRLMACADARGDVRESDEHNNCTVAATRVSVDTTSPPAPVIDARPADPDGRVNARFEFSDAEPGTGFWCRVDDDAFAACTSPHEIAGLSEGAHRFEVKARDAAGNESAAAAFDWTVDLTAPATPVIDEHPNAITTADRARFAFSADEAGVRFACALDDHEWEPCESPHEYTSLDAGDHRFRVTARDAAGNESAPAAFEWTVERDAASLGDGAWSWFADPRGVHDRGRTYIGWVARDGDVKVSAYDHATRARTTALVAPAVQIDDHANPALQVLPDGRLRVYYSAHAGSTMSYRTSLRPEDVTAWDPARTLPANSPGPWGYTYPNPVRLRSEGTTYLFWRGGNFNPTFSTQSDGADTWSTPRTLVSVAGERPYVKVDSNGEDAIHFGFTNAHPNEAGDVNIYYAAYRGGQLYRADGTRIGALGTPIAPAQADTVYDTGRKAWMHDIALDAQGRPVIVFASFAATSDHRYMYARWSGREWVTHEMTAAGGSISDDGKEPYYSGGITLDHEDPTTAYLSRPIDGVYEIETWTTRDGGATWTRVAVTSQSSAKNIRPVSPRGLVPFSSDLSVAWMRGVYASYIDYRTSITTLLLTGGNAAPIADATLAPRSGPAPQEVAFDARASSDEDGAIAAYHWEFGDGSTGTGDQVRHRYEQPGRYFPALTVTDERGATDTFITEVTVQPSRAPDVTTGPAGDVDADSAVLNGTLNPHNQRTTYHFEHGTTSGYGNRTPDEQILDPDDADRRVQAVLTGLIAGQTYHYRLVATNATGTTAGADRTFTAAPPSPSAYRAAILQTPGLVAYWRLGEHDGTTAIDETGAFAGNYASVGVRLGEPGALSGDPDTSVWFDGTRGEMTAATAQLSTSGTLEGWFDWRSGVALMRDNTSVAGAGWILAFETNTGRLAYRLGGTTFTTTKTVAELRGSWHHIAATKNGSAVALYLDGEPLHSANAAGALTPALPWHVMRNGNSPTEYTQGRADEITVYNTALSITDIKRHYQAGRGA